MRAAAALAVVALVACLGGAAAAQEPDRAGDEFRAASQQLAAGELEAAQRAFEAVAAMDPQGPWADDALSEAAQIAERRDDLAAARQLWRRVVDEHPSSRQVRRARARLAEIERAIGAGGEWLAVAEQHEAIVTAAVGQSDPNPQVRELEALIAAHPDYPRAHDARMWIGDTWLRLGYPERAAAVFRAARAAATAPEGRWRAGKALGDALVASGDLDGAEAQYRSLLGEGDAMADRVLADELEDVARLHARARWVAIAWIALGLAFVAFALHAWRAAGGLRAALRGLARPPLEVAFFIPPALVMFMVALAGNYLVEQAVRMILLGGLAITWLGGASLQLARRRGRLGLAVVALHVAAAVAAGVALCYLAITDDQLVDMLRETWAHGPER